MSGLIYGKIMHYNPQPKQSYRLDRINRKKAQKDELQEFSRKVRALDKRCMNPKCPDRDNKSFHAHHIIGRGQCGTNEPGNGITLCPLCHLRIHSEPSWALELLSHYKGKANDRWQTVRKELEKKT